MATEIENRRRIALLAASLAFALIQFDASVVNVALESVRRALGGDIGPAQWVVDGYTIPFAALMLIAGAAGDRFGRRRICVLGFALFAVATAACALAGAWTALIAARVAQGTAAALILPSSLAMIGELFPDPAARARALGVWGGIASAGFAAGPPLGGVLVSGWGWRSVFWVGLPVALLAGAAVRVTGPADRHRRRGLDVRGAAFGAAALGTAVAAVIEAGQGRAASAAGLATVTVLVAVGFAWSQRGVVDPLVPPVLRRSRRFRAAVATGFVFNFALYGALLCVGLGLQSRPGFTVLDTGLAMLPMTVTVALGSTVSGLVTARLGPRPPMVAGFLLAALGAVTVAVGAASTPAVVLGLMVIGAASLAMPAMTSVALAAAPSADAGVASAVLNTARQAGGAIGVAALGAVYALTGALPVVFTLVAAVLMVGAGTSVGATTDRNPQEVEAHAR